VDEGGGDVLPGLGASENPGRLLLDILEPVQGFAGNPGQDSVPVIQTKGESGDVFAVVERRFRDGLVRSRDEWVESRRRPRLQSSWDWQ
jgi:hypothetical protein